MKRKFKIGERVWDDCDSRWGYIALIQGKDADAELDEDDAILTLDDEPDFASSHSEWETTAGFCYQIAECKTFQGEIVCREHVQMEGEYPYFCPERSENLYEVELN